MGFFAIVIDALAIFIVGGVGDVLRPKVGLRDRRIILQSCGAVVFVLGLGGFMTTMVDITAKQAEIDGSFFPAVMLVAGLGIGYALRVEDGLLKVGRVFVGFFDRDKKKKRLDPSLVAENFDGLLVRGEDQFGYGFALSTVLVSSGVFFMNAVTGNTEIALVKAAVDAVLVFALAVVYGGGAAMSALSVVVMQGVLGFVFFMGGEANMTPKFIDQMTVLSAMIMTVAGCVMISGKRFKVGDLLPAYGTALVYQLAVVSVMPV